MNNSAAHTALKAEILLAHGARPGVRLFNNPVGEAWMGRPLEQTRETITLMAPRRIAFGLCAGSTDLIGFKSVTITPEMVGRTIAQFLAPEVKTGKGQPRDDQTKFMAALVKAGALTGVVRSVDDLADLIEGRNLFGVGGQS